MLQIAFPSPPALAPDHGVLDRAAREIVGIADAGQRVAQLRLWGLTAHFIGANFSEIERRAGLLAEQLSPGAN